MGSISNGLDVSRWAAHARCSAWPMQSPMQDLELVQQTSTAAGCAYVC